MKDDVLFESLSEIPSAIKDDSGELIECGVGGGTHAARCASSSLKSSIESTYATSAAAVTTMNEKIERIQFQNVGDLKGVLFEKSFSDFQ